MHKFLNDLNETQREAVINYKGASLVIAGAGSGKTRVLTYRIAYLLSQGKKPSSILALTFTNKASKEMRERISSLVGYETAKYLWMGTFHSIFAKILRIEADKLGYNSNYTIYDTADSKSLLKTIIKKHNLDEKLYKPSEILSRISKVKNNLITPQAYNQNSAFLEADKRSRRPYIGQLYKEYAIRCYKAGAMDFDDLLLNTNILLKKFPEVKEKYQNKFNFILVDEYQDTNYSQYLIIKTLAELHNNICVVGDDAQSIYSFRGARIENILNFQSNYPNYLLYKLERNYRSTQNIVNAANSIIAKNKSQIQKKVFTENEAGNKIKLIKAATDNEEGYIVSNLIIESKLNHRIRNNDIAILYRTNAQSRIFEEALRKLNIPYKIYGGLSFYQRKEIKDLLAYLRLIVNHNDDEALKRVINYPARGIGKTSFEKLESTALQLNTSIMHVIENIKSTNIQINNGTINKINNFANFIKEFSNKLANTDAYDIAYSVASSSGMLKEFYKDRTPENISRHENIQELLNGIKEFTLSEQEDGQIVGLENYLENVSLLTNMDNEKSEDFDKVTLMTIHSAKGLEFEHVFVVGVEEDLFPSHLSINSIQELEEERRLFYVAITRAKKHICISYANSRFKWGTLKSCNPSRFVKEIDEKYLDIAESLEQTSNKIEFVHNDNNYKKNYSQKKKTYHVSTYDKNGKTLRKISNYNASNEPAEHSKKSFVSNTSDIQVGMQVKHTRFGVGKVIEISGEYPNTKATVFFKNSGQKQLLLKFAKLDIVN